MLAYDGRLCYTDDCMVSLSDVVALCKRRGFIFPSSEIYGGLSSSWDYGPLGVEMKRQIEATWWREMTQRRREIVGLDSAIMMHPQVWKASGHIDNFSDLMSEDTVTNERYRWDMLSEEQRQTMTSPNGNALSEPRAFNLMFKSHLGPIENDKGRIYLRPETAQGIYVNYKNITQSTRVSLPFGVAQVGKAFRNEIMTKQFVFRTCEFEQLEMQYFVEPTSAPQWFAYWRDARIAYYEQLGIRPEKLRFKPHGADELAHYAKEATDIQYEFPFGWQELEGIHNRGDYDLKQHSEYSGKDLRYRAVDGQQFIPYIVETSAGLTRSLLMVLCDAYHVQKLADDERTVLHIHPRIAPITAAVFPLVKKDGLAELAQEIEEELRMQLQYRTFYDQGGAIGRRYRRQDEIGTPFCITVDYDTKEGRGVTIRSRDSMAQERVARAGIGAYLSDAIANYAIPQR